MTTLVVGDVHGCADELARLLAKVQPSEVIFVGDLFTKGPDPVSVYRMVAAHRAVLGNHDQRLLAALKGERPRDRHAREVIKVLDKGARGWRKWTRALPLFAEVGGFTVVHAGLHPSGRLEDTTRKMALTMRRYPLQNPEAPFWWEAYHGERRVIFGHDARRGLVRVARRGRTQLVGLDTGCVYGGRLSGYVIERDEVVSVKARRVYMEPGR